MVRLRLHYLSQLNEFVVLFDTVLAKELLIKLRHCSEMYL